MRDLKSLFDYHGKCAQTDTREKLQNYYASSLLQSTFRSRSTQIVNRQMHEREKKKGTGTPHQHQNPTFPSRR